MVKGITANSQETSRATKEDADNRMTIMAIMMAILVTLLESITIIIITSVVTIIATCIPMVTLKLMVACMRTLTDRLKTCTDSTLRLTPPIPPTDTQTWLLRGTNNASLIREAVWVQVPREANKVIRAIKDSLNRVTRAMMLPVARQAGLLSVVESTR